MELHESPPTPVSPPPRSVPVLSRFQEWLHHHRHTRVLIALVGVVMLWRGVWALLDEYFFPDQPLASYLGSIGLGLLLLFIDDYRLREIE